MTTVTINQIAPEFQVDGQALAATWWSALVSMRIERELNVVGRAVLRFADVGYQLSASTIFSIGSAVKISSYQGGPLFDGIVTGANLEQVAGEHPELVITVDDKACKLGLDTKVVAHVNKTYSGIVNAMIGSTGLSGDVTLGGVGETNREYVLQSSTDLAFLDTIVRRANCMWWVENGALMVTKAGEVNGPALDIELGRDLLDFSVRASGLRPTKVSVNGWDAEAQADIVSPGDTPPPTATSSFTDEYTGSKGGMEVDGKQIAGEGNPNDSAEAQALASSLATAWHSAAVVARGTTFVNAGIGPATKIHVSKAGPSSGNYTVSAVEHVYNRTGFFTKFIAGPVRPSRLVDTLGNEGPDTGFAMTGLITGMVSDADDPNGQGRVKVNYTGSGGNLVSNWARVVSLGGGAERGTVFIPEVNDEVLVGFERGDSRHPVVIGGLFSQKTKIAADNKLTGGGKISYRRITSRLGHVVELADGDGQSEQHVLMKLGNAAHKLRLGADRFDIEMASGMPIAIKAGSAKFEIDDQGNITIEGNSIKLKAQMDVGIEASGGKFTAKGAVGTEISGLKVDIKADTTANLEGNAMTTVKGGQVMIN